MKSLNPKMKYWLEDNKDKLMIGGAVLALGIVGFGAYSLIDKDKNYQVGEDIEVAMADYLLTQRSDGDLELYNIEDNESISTYDLESNAIAFYGEELDSLYVYENDTVRQAKIADGEIHFDEALAVPELNDVQAIQVGGGHFGFLTPQELVITNDAGEPIIVFEDNEANEYQLTDKGIYLAMDTETHFVDYADGETKYIDIGDVTTKLSQHGDTIVARNDFGSGENVQTVLNIKDGDLLIDNLKRVPFDGKLDLQVPRSENQLVYIHYTRNKQDEITRQDLATIPIHMELDGEETEDIDLKEFTLPLESKETFTESSAIASRGFLYDDTGNGLRIVEMRNGREAARLNVNDSQLFVPIYLK